MRNVSTYIQKCFLYMNQKIFIVKRHRIKPFYIRNNYSVTGKNNCKETQLKM